MNWRDISHPEAGGCELHLHEITKRLAKWGHDITLFCGAYEGSKEEEVVDGIRVIRKGGPYTVYFRSALDYIFRLRKKRFDIVVDDINGVPFFTPFYIGRPKLAILHHLVKDIFFRELPVPLRPVAYLAERSIPVYYGRTKFVTVSDSTKNEMIAAGIPSDNIHVIHNGISGDYSPDKNNRSQFPHLVYLGRLKAYKQLDHLLKVVGILKNDFKRLHLSIAGTGDAEEDLKKKAGELGIGNMVDFLGFISEKEKVELLQSGWLFVTPSEKEGWGLTVIEANACGLPTVGYDVPGLRDSIKKDKTGLLVENMEPKYLAEGVRELLSNDGRREKMAENALKWSENFSWDKTARRFLDLISEEML